MKGILKLAVLALAAGAASACVARGALRDDLARGLPAAPAAGPRVVLARRPGPPESLRHRELPWSSALIDLKPYPEAVAAMLSGLFADVSVASSTGEARGSDYVVLIATGYPRTVGLAFQDGSGKLLASFSRPGWEPAPSPEADSLVAKFLTPPGMVVSFGALGLAFGYRVHEARRLISGRLSDVTAAALREIREQIAADPALRPTGAPLPPPRSSAADDARAEADKLEKQAAELRRRAAELEAKPSDSR